MRSTLRNESNTGNSQCALRKSCSFAFGAALLSTLLFASAAHSQSTCAASLSTDGTTQQYCQETDTSATVWVAVNGSWQRKEYLRTDTDTAFLDVFWYDYNLWTAWKYATGEEWVQRTPGPTFTGDWESSADYNSLQSAQVLAQFNSVSNTPATAPNTGAAFPVTFSTGAFFCQVKINELKYAQDLQAQGFNVPLPAVPSICGQL
jgi:hypothetical protein